MNPQVVLPLAGYGSGELGAAALVGLARDAGLDLRRRMFVAFVIDFAGQREDAYAAELSVRDTNWDSALYGDATGWVLRLSRSRQLTRDVAAADLAEVTALAARYCGQVRGAAVEDLRHDDVWGELAARLQDGGRRADDAGADEAHAGPLSVPSPREHRVARVELTP